jgi:hypothetical protein
MRRQEERTKAGGGDGSTSKSASEGASDPEQIVDNKPVFLSRRVHEHDSSAVDRKGPRAKESTNESSSSTRVSVALFLFPVRSPDRAYDMHLCERADAKPRHRKVQLQLSTPDSMCSPATSSRSMRPPLRLLADASSMPSGGSLVAIRVVNDQVYMFPVDDMLQMRPRTDELHKRRQEESERTQNKAKQHGGAAKQQQSHEAQHNAPGDGDTSGQSNTVATSQHVVRSTQAERKEEQRMNSYAYMKQQEEQEPWQRLQFNHPLTARSRSLVNSITDVSHNVPKVKSESDGDVVMGGDEAGVRAPDRYLDWIAPLQHENAGGSERKAHVKEERDGPT